MVMCNYSEYVIGRIHVKNCKYMKGGGGNRQLEATRCKGGANVKQGMLLC
jgi:hypothetical protein